MNHPTSLDSEVLDRPIDLDEADEEARLAAARRVRHGFLPIVTNWFDRVFIGIYLFVALELFWMRFLEQSIPLFVCHVLALALGVLIVWKG
jgi:predicted small integral membrane protein